MEDEQAKIDPQPGLECGSVEEMDIDVGTVADCPLVILGPVHQLDLLLYIKFGDSADLAQGATVDLLEGLPEDLKRLVDAGHFRVFDRSLLNLLNPDVDIVDQRRLVVLWPRSAQVLQDALKWP